MYEKLPEAYKGKQRKHTHLTKHAPRTWTAEEVAHVKKLQAAGATIQQVAESLDRDLTQVQIKLKRLAKQNGETYNEPHRAAKYLLNDAFLKCLAPGSVLDLYSGATSYYEGKVGELCTNDSNADFIHLSYNEKAERLIHKLYYEGSSYDLVDLDPFGSAYDCLDLAIKMARKGLVVTLGELGHRRFKRLDYVSRCYGIETLEDFTAENLAACIIKIGLRHKKQLELVELGKWRHIARAYFTVAPLKLAK